MSNPNPSTVAAIEIGTATIKVVIARVEDGRFIPQSLGACSSQGVVAGTVVDPTAAADCIHAAIAAAERKADIRIDRVHLAQSGAHIDSFSHEAAVDISTADQRVRRTDIAAVCERARGVELPPERSVVHYLRRPFRLDGRIVLDPENSPGRRLEVGYSIVHGDSSRIYAAIKLLNGLDIRVDEIILSSLASASVVTSAEERRVGVLVLDTGAGTTDYVLYRENFVPQTGVLPVGGNHITQDLCCGLRVTEPQAEQLKCRYARCEVNLPVDDKLVWLDADLALLPHPVPRQAIEQIATLRVRELFETVQKRLHRAFDPASIGAGVVITGGTAMLPGIAELATDVFGLPARVGVPAHSDASGLSDPSYSTVLGLLRYCTAIR